MFWIDADKALPAMNGQIVKFKVNLAKELRVPDKS